MAAGKRSKATARAPVGVWECPDCGQHFATKEKCLRHMAEHPATQRQEICELHFPLFGDGRPWYERWEPAVAVPGRIPDGFVVTRDPVVDYGTRLLTVSSVYGIDLDGVGLARVRKKARDACLSGAEELADRLMSACIELRGESDAEKEKTGEQK